MTDEKRKVRCCWFESHDPYKQYLKTTHCWKCHGWDEKTGEIEQDKTTCKNWKELT